MARPKRSAPGAATTRSAAKKDNQQSKLSFRSTKAHDRPAKDLDAKDDEPSLKKIRVSEGESVDVADVQPDEEQTTKDTQTLAPAPAAAASPAAPDAEAESPADAEEEEEYFAQARQIKDAQIRRYWSSKEAARKAPRVHQQGLTVWEKVLREFDVTARFGPSIGISRTRRWERAWELGLAPPVEVLAVLLRKEEAVGERSVVDEIMGSKVAAVDA